MKGMIALAACVLLMAGMAAGQQSMSTKTEAQAAPANVEKHLMELENRWNKASLAHDGSALAPLLAEGFINLDSDGTMRTKDETVQRASKSNFQVSELSDLKVVSHGNSAIVTGVWTGKGTDADGKPVDAKERWVDTWVMRNGRWVCIASAAAPMKSM